MQKAIRTFLIISVSLLPLIVIDIFSARIPVVNGIVSEQTVKNHIYSIYKKTGVFSRVELINKINTLRNTL